MLTLARFRWLTKPSELDRARAHRLYDELSDDDIARMQAWDVVDERGQVVYEMLYHCSEAATFYRPGQLVSERSPTIITDEIVCHDEPLAEALTRAISAAQRSIEGAYLDAVVLADGPPYGIGRVLGVTRTE